MNETLVPARELFREFPPTAVIAFYLLAAASLATFAWGCWLRVRKYRAGRRLEPREQPWRRVLKALAALATQSTLRKRNASVGWAHALVFWGFAVLFAGTVLITLDQDVLEVIDPGLQFWRGDFYLAFSLALDLMGLAFLAGLAMLGVRRSVAKPPQLDYARPDRARDEYDRLGYVRDDRIFLWGLFAVGVTGFLTESLRIAADRPAFEVWSIVGWQLASALGRIGISSDAAGMLHPWGWWLHAVLALGFIAYIPYSKAIHMLAAMVNLALRDPLAGRRLPAPPAAESGTGYASLTDLTWKELLGLDACTRCGRCHVACPARAGGWPLSPRDAILELREHAEAHLGGRSWLREKQARPGTSEVAGTVLRARTLWSCTTCLACVEACPVGVEHVPLVVQMRRRLVEGGSIDRNLQRALEHIAQYGNSFGEPAQRRARWTEGLAFQIKDARSEPVDVLWFVGDHASFDPEAQVVTRAAARLFHRAGLDFGIVYDDERNSGNDVRRIGEEGLYEMLVRDNLATLGRARFRRIVTTDPHSYNTLRFEYPRFGGAFRVLHASELLAELIGSGKLVLDRRLDVVATYHDPCHLSRYARLTEAPRALLRALGATLREMPRNRANSFCCGAGGGRLWMTDTGTEARPSEQRIAEALAIPGLQYFVTACPKDLKMYRDALKASGSDGRVEIRDLIELVEMGLVPREATHATQP